MRNLCVAILSSISLTLAAFSQEIPATSQITSIGLFKNGLAVVHRGVTVTEPGVYCLTDVPEPVHGTFWIESNAQVEARVTTREVEEQVHAAHGSDFQRLFEGQQVSIFFRDAKIPPAAGKVIKVAKLDDSRAWNRRYHQTSYHDYYRYNDFNRNQNPSDQPTASAFLVLETTQGNIYIERSMIAYLQAQGAMQRVKIRKPVLLLEVKALKEKPSTVDISYLTKGISWAPSYRMDISDPKTLGLQQQAVIKNELGDVIDAEISLISGFPSVQFGHVTSPLSLSTTWANFFSELNQRPQSGHDSMSNVTSQQMVIQNAPIASGLDMSATPSGEGVDLHYHSLGKRTLQEGDSLCLETVKAKASYERIVEWIVADTRAANGRYIQEYERDQNPDKYQDAAWDAVRFKNPFSFPMTTGSTMVVSNGRFNGQRMSFWVNAGEETTLQITKALSIRTRSTEQEEEGNREIVYVGGNDFRKTTVKGQLSISNHRKEDVKVVIRRRFSGDLLEAEGAPKNSLLEEGVYAVNKRNELTWTLVFKPGEEKTLTYRYAVLVDN